MPLFYHKYVNYVLAHSVNYVITLYTFALSQSFQNCTIPRLARSHLPPLSKGGGLTARHKLLLCCVLIAIRPPFLFIKLFCRQDGGIVTSNLSIPTTLIKAHHRPRLAPHSCLPSKRGRWIDCIAKPLFYINFIL